MSRAKNTKNKYKENSRKHFNKQAPRYMQTWDGRYCSRMYDSIMANIQPHPFDALLEVGCGPGELLALLAQKYPDAETFGMDLSEGMIAQAQKKLYPPIELRIGDVEEMPWPQHRFDLLICNAAFHHFPDPLKSLAEMCRVLKPGGKVVIADPWWSKIIRLAINGYLKSPFNYSGDFRIYSRQEMEQLLAVSGFTEITWELVNHTYFLATAVAADQ